MSVSTVIYDREGLVGKIIINRPQKKNALDLETLRGLIEAFKQSAENDDLCVIFTSEGEDFSAGLDLKCTKSILNDNDVNKSIEVIRCFQDLTRAIRNHSGVVIAGLKGYVIGGAFEITLSCDLRVASKDTKIIMPELNVGAMLTNASTKLLPQLIGEAKAKELIFLGDMITAEEALSIGLVNSVVEQDSLMNELENIAKKIVKKAPLSLKFAKKLINENQDVSIETALEREFLANIICGQSRDFREGVQAFFEKREPKFEGR